MIAHLDNGKSTEIRPGAATMGLRVVRWEFDFNDMSELLKNPELLPILATRMVPMKLTEEQIWKCNDDGDGSYHICVAHQNVVEFARAIEREIGFDNADRWLKRMEAAIKDEREACAQLLDEMAAADKLTNYYRVAALRIRERGAP
jgi:hypothetical protein